MCGIAGYFGTKNISISKIKKTLNLMKNRGPDFQGYYRKKIKKKIFFYYTPDFQLLI